MDLAISSLLPSVRPPPLLQVQHCHHLLPFPSQRTRASRPSLVLCSNHSTLEELRRQAEETLDWRDVCRQVASFASTAAGRVACLAGGLRPWRDRAESEALLEQTRAAVELPRRIDFSEIDDVSGLVRSTVAGGLLGVRELCKLGRSLRGAERLYKDLVSASGAEGNAQRYSSLLEIFRNCNFLTGLVHKIDLCIDKNLFVILDQASPRLESIRSERSQNAANLESLLKGISSKILHAGGIDKPLVTRRRSRMCIGIRASHKALLPDAIILDISGSGSTYFVEPREAIDLNNMEVRLSDSERNEELAILHMLTSHVEQSNREITYLMERILELDLALARGYHAAWLNGVCPVFNEVTGGKQINKAQEIFSVNIEAICHPLLLERSLKASVSSPVRVSGPAYIEETHKEVNYSSLTQDDAVVPIDIKIRGANKVVVISGPNTGGKTVAMKTLGLASLMSKAGLFIPAKSHSKLPWFDNILADIGDQQSLEHNLSTFSGHMLRICQILEASTQQSLVLIDEIGNGTDPSEGVALSISILQHLVDVVGLALVTTHYADLTTLKGKDSRFENAAMEFCMETLQPTYRILWGSIGNSNAINIAKRIGFEQKVLDHAEAWIQRLLPDKQEARHGLLYDSLLEEKNLLKAQADKAKSILAESKRLFHEISSEAEGLDRREEVLKVVESRRVHRELKYFKSQMDLIIKNFDSQLQNAKVDLFVSLIRQAEVSIASIVDSHRLPEDPSSGKSNRSPYIPKSGDQVRIKGFGNKITIIVGEVDDDYILVQCEKIRIRVKRSDIILVKSSKKVPLRKSKPIGGSRE